LDRIFKLLSSDWLIHQDTAISYLPVLISFLNGQKLDVVAGSLKPPQRISGFRSDADPEWVDQDNLSDISIPENSIAVIPIQDTILSWKTQRMVGQIKQADANPQICAILFLVSSPGGMVSQLDIAASAIKNCSKPTVVVISQMAASAAMWLSSAANYRIATSPIDAIGSIGTKTSFMDINGFLKEKLNISVYEIYATLSTKKEEEIRELLKGNDKPIVAKLDFINAIFHKTIQDNLGIPEGSEVFTGAIYFAEQAKSLGLINEINTIDYAVNFTYELGLANKIKSNPIFNN